MNSNDLVIKILRIVSLTELDIYLSVFDPTIPFVMIFDDCVTSYGILNGVFIIDVYLYIFIEEKTTLS